MSAIFPSHAMLCSRRSRDLQATMRRHRFGLALLALVALVAPLASAIAIGAPNAYAAPAAMRMASTGNVTILVLDMSGSMGNPGGSGNDPDGLRCSAADAFISLSGPNQFVGVVGLVGDTQAKTWASPSEMATIQARQQLIQTVKEKSNNCYANGNTPTFGALSKAYAMLQSTATNGRVGSVILLTDGVPAPNTGQQQSDIITQLVPKFRSSHFPINTIALGSDPSTGSFLREVASGTLGQYNSDYNPATGQPDPLEIAPVFLGYFAALTHRAPKPLVQEDTLNGGVTQRNFTVDDLTQHLDAVVIAQDPSARISLISPDGVIYNARTPSVTGRTVVFGAHYAMFSFDNPTPGNWIVSIAGGSRQFSVYGLARTTLSIALTQPNSTHPLTYPIDQSLPISAQLTSNGVAINDNFTVTALLQTGGHIIQQGSLAHQAGSDVYRGSLGLPPGQPSGAYTLTLQVTRGSGDPLTTSAPLVIDFEIFPQPYLLTGAGAQKTAVTATVTAFPLPFQMIYSLPVFKLPFFSWFSGVALSGIPATPSAVVNGVLTLHGKIYTKSGSLVEGSATTANHKATQAAVTTTAPGHFKVIFPAATDGTYDLNLSATGNFLDSHGSFGPTTARSVTLTVVPATFSQDARALIATLIYLLILIFLAPLFYRWFQASPRGTWTQYKGASNRGERIGSGNLNAPRDRPRHYFRHWFRRNVVGSDELWGFPGLLLTWTHFSGASIRPDGRAAEHWEPHKRGGIDGTLTYSVVSTRKASGGEEATNASGKQYTYTLAGADGRGAPSTSRRNRHDDGANPGRSRRSSDARDRNTRRSGRPASDDGANGRQRERENNRRETRQRERRESRRRGADADRRRSR